MYKNLHRKGIANVLQNSRKRWSSIRRNVSLRVEFQNTTTYGSRSLAMCAKRRVVTRAYVHDKSNQDEREQQRLSGLFNLMQIPDDCICQQGSEAVLSTWTRSKYSREYDTATSGARRTARSTQSGPRYSRSRTSKRRRPLLFTPGQLLCDIIHRAPLQSIRQTSARYTQGKRQMLSELPSGNALPCHQVKRTSFNLFRWNDVPRTSKRFFPFFPFLPRNCNISAVLSIQV